MLLILRKLGTREINMKQSQIIITFLTLILLSRNDNIINDNIIDNIIDNISILFLDNNYIIKE